MEHVQVGPFKLPGIVYDYSLTTPEEVYEIEAWATENKCGTLMGPGFWSFRNEKQREWWILRWSDFLQEKENAKKDND
jgi:hypothetical protein